VKAQIKLTIATAVVILTAAYGHGEAQPAAKVWRIGYLDQGSAKNNLPYLALRQGLRELGWSEDQSITVDARFAEGKTDHLHGLAAELVRLKMDIIVTTTTPAALAAKRATTTIPIVFGAVADPVGSGVVTSLARPAGNITGWTHQGLELRAKYLEFLKEAVPKATRFGALWNPTNQVHPPSLKILEGAARTLKVDLQLVGVQDADGLDDAFATLTAKLAEALIVFPDGMFFSQRFRIVALAQRSRLPTL
jgi:putative ABC transport system substrate-binding protein